MARAREETHISVDRIVYRPTWDGRVPTLGRPQGICQFSGCKQRTTGSFTHKGLTFDLCDRHLFAALG